MSVSELRGQLNEAITKAGEAAAAGGEAKQQLQGALASIDEATALIAAALGQDTSESLEGATHSFTAAHGQVVAMLYNIDELHSNLMNGQEHCQEYMRRLGG